MARHPDPDNPQPYQRRIGERHPIQVELTWGPTPRSRWSRTPRWTVTSDNVSLSGIGFSSEPRDEIVRGQAVRITLEGVTAGALVKVARPDDSGDEIYYGLEFQEGEMLEVAKKLITDFEASADAAGG